MPRQCFPTIWAHWSWFHVLLSLSKVFSNDIHNTSQGFLKASEKCTKFWKTPPQCREDVFKHFGHIEFASKFYKVFENSLGVTLHGLPKALWRLLLTTKNPFFYFCNWVSCQCKGCFQSKVESLNHISNGKNSNWRAHNGFLGPSQCFVADYWGSNCLCRWISRQREYHFQSKVELQNIFPNGTRTQFEKHIMVLHGLNGVLLLAIGGPIFFVMGILSMRVSY